MMKLRTNVQEIESHKIDYVFVDNDYLAILYTDTSGKILEETLALFKDKLTLDPFTIFEFSRDIYKPKVRSNKKLFIENRIFNKMPDHPELFNQTKNYAIELSLIYTSQKTAKGASLVDLMLAGQMAKAGKNVALLTGNRKDFPSLVFDTLSVLTIEKIVEKVDHLQSFSLLQFNQTNYEYYKKILNKIDTENTELLKEA